MKRQYWVLAILAVLAGGVWWLTYVPTPTPGGLAARALSASSADDRAYAVTQLTLLPHSQMVQELVRVARESKDAEVIVIAVNKLGTINYVDNVPLYLSLLKHDDARVGKAAYAALAGQRGGAELEGAEYNAADPADKRSLASQKIAELIQEKDSEARAKKRARTAVAAAPAAKTTLAEEPKDSIKPNLPSPSVAPSSPPPSYEVMPAWPPYDFTAMRLIAWLCRSLAFGIFLIPVIVTIGLLRGGTDDLKVKKRRTALHAAATHDRPALTEDRLDKALPATDVPGWSAPRIFAWALAAIAMLLVAEFILVAVHFVERYEHTSRMR